MGAHNIVIHYNRQQYCALTFLVTIETGITETCVSVISA